MKKKERLFHTDAFTRGGQIFSHEWRMRLQNLRLVLMLSLIFLIVAFTLSLSLFSLTAWHILNFYTFTYVGGILKIKLWTFCQPFFIWLNHLIHGALPWVYTSASTFVTHLHLPKGGQLIQRTAEFLGHPWTQRHVAMVTKAIIFILGVWMSSIVSLTIFLRRKSQRLEEGKCLNGEQLAKSQDLQKILIRTKQASDIKLTPELSLIKDAETQHMMILGTTGSGKTNCIHGLLKQIQKKNQPVIILDTTGGYVNRYYNEERGDKILNPCDTRSVQWTLWKDCLHTPDYDALATALIPEPTGSSNPVWHKNAREIISTTAEKLGMTLDPTLQALIENASWKALSEVKSFYENTPVESLMNASGRAEETVHSVRMQMTDAMKRLAFIPTTGKPFSLIEWVEATQVSHEAPSAQSWLFISCTEKDRATVGPLMKFWMSLTIQGLLKRGEDHDHRVWFILDELFSLEGGPVSNLMTLLSEGRKYGGCAVLGFQSLASLEKTQGQTGMKELISLCNTKIILRTPEPQHAGYLCQVLGEKEVMEASESLSMGAHHMRDGVSVSSQRRLKPIVTKTDIMTLDNLEAYVSLGRGYPVTRLTFPLIKVPLQHPSKTYERSLSLLSQLENKIDSSICSHPSNEEKEKKEEKREEVKDLSSPLSHPHSKVFSKDYRS